MNALEGIGQNKRPRPVGLSRSECIPSHTPYIFYLTSTTTNDAELILEELGSETGFGISHRKLLTGTI